jgi:cleavage stimulation factor subunit 3
MRNYSRSRKTSRRSMQRERFLSVLCVDLEALESRINSANSSLSSISTTASASNPPPTTEVGVQSTNSSFATQASDEEPPKSKELSERRTEYGVVWIIYMRFGQRAEGLQSSRSIFSRARKDRWTPWEVFEAAGAINPLRTRVTL